MKSQIRVDQLTDSTSGRLIKDLRHENLKNKLYIRDQTECLQGCNQLKISISKCISTHEQPPNYLETQKDYFTN